VTIRDAFLWGREHLAATGVAEPAIEADLLLRRALGWDRAQMYTRWDSPLDGGAWDRYRVLLDARAGGRPVHYILGEREFMGLLFAVDERVLIPRPETEVLTEVIIDFLNGNREQRTGNSQSQEVRSPFPVPRSRQLVVDVGTGSGCIAVAIAHFVPDAAVIATDISRGALDVAASNARRHGVESRIEFLEGDLLTPLPQSVQREIDVLVSNPPYVPPQDAAGLPREIREFEPTIAVVGQEDGLAVHRRLISEGTRWLKPGGLLALEVGTGQALAVAGWFREADYAVIRTIQDYAGIDRVVTATYAPESTQGTLIVLANT
jgi:release factor glutamine methyltransferase